MFENAGSCMVTSLHEELQKIVCQVSAIIGFLKHTSMEYNRSESSKNMHGHANASLVCEEGLQNGQSVRKVSTHDKMYCTYKTLA